MTNFRRKAFYSAAPGGLVVCHRCRVTMKRDEMAAHTAVCWPDVANPDDSGETAEPRDSPTNLLTRC